MFGKLQASVRCLPRLASPGTDGSFALQGQAGYMSYQDIDRVLGSSGATVVTDKKDAVKYFRYDDDQWISYDDEETIKWKVEFANSQG
jgi:chitinase